MAKVISSSTVDHIKTTITNYQSNGSTKIINHSVSDIATNISETAGANQGETDTTNYTFDVAATNTGPTTTSSWVTNTVYSCKMSIITNVGMTLRTNYQYYVNEPSDPSYPDFLKFCNRFKNAQYSHALTVGPKTGDCTMVFCGTNAKLADVLATVQANLSVSCDSNNQVTVTQPTQGLTFIEDTNLIDLTNTSTAGLSDTNLAGLNDTNPPALSDEDGVPVSKKHQYQYLFDRSSSQSQLKCSLCSEFQQ